MPNELILHGIPVTPFLNRANATGVSSTFALPALAGSLTWQTSFGTAPASVTIDLEFSLDGVTWDAVDTTTVTAGEVRTFSTVGGRFVRINCTAVTGGTTTTVTILCQRS